MTEDEVIRMLREYFARLFPKVCQNCNRRFATLQEYILITTRLGPAISYDAELNNWETTQPIGTMAQANCPCGSTLALTTKDMVMSQRLELLKWMRTESERRGISPSELLEHLRDEVRKQVLKDTEA
jgi:hypothetical protein